MSATIKACGQWQLAIELLTVASCQMIQPSIDTLALKKEWFKVCALGMNFTRCILGMTSMVGLHITSEIQWHTMCGFFSVLDLCVLIFEKPTFQFVVGSLMIITLYPDEPTTKISKKKQSTKPYSIDYTRMSPL